MVSRVDFTLSLFGKLNYTVFASTKTTYTNKALIMASSIKVSLTNVDFTETCLALTCLYGYFLDMCCYCSANCTSSWLFAQASPGYDSKCQHWRENIDCLSVHVLTVVKQVLFAQVNLLCNSEPAMVTASVSDMKLVALVYCSTTLQPLCYCSTKVFLQRESSSEWSLPRWSLPRWYYLRWPHPG